MISSSQIGSPSPEFRADTGKSYGNKSTDTRALIHFRSKSTQCQLPPSPKWMKLDVGEVFGSLSKLEKSLLAESDERVSDVTDTESDQVASEAESEGSMYSPSDHSLNSTFNSIVSDENYEEEKWYIKRPREYTGIAVESHHIIDVLSQYIKCNPEEIYVVLVKI